MVKLLSLILVFYSTTAIGQSDKKHFNDYLSSNNYLGCDLLFPKLKKDWKSDNPWIGINAQMQYFHIGYAVGTATKQDSTGIRSGNGYVINAGLFYNYPIHVARNVVTLEPEIGLDFNLGRFKDDPSSSPIGVGFGVIPGIGLKIGPAKVVLKYNASFALNLFDKTNAWSGGMAYPVLSTYLETGWGLLNPKKIQSKGTYSTSDIRYTYEGVEQVGNSWWGVYRVTVQTYDHTFQSSIHDVGPFWYISPKISSSRGISGDKRNTMQYGLALGGRSGIIGGDLYFTTGTMGFGSQLNPDQMNNAFGETKDHSGGISANTMGINGGVEFFGLLTKLFVHTHEDRSVFSATRYLRLFLNGGYGLSQFSGAAEYTSPTAVTEINQYNSIYPALSASQTPGYFKQSTFYTLGFKVEIGMVSAGFDKYFYKDASYCNGYAFTLQYLIPPGRILRASKEMSRVRKAFLKK